MREGEECELFIPVRVIVEIPSDRRAAGRIYNFLQILWGLRRKLRAGNFVIGGLLGVWAMVAYSSFSYSGAVWVTDCYREFDFHLNFYIPPISMVSVDLTSSKSCTQSMSVGEHGQAPERQPVKVMGEG